MLIPMSDRDINRFKVLQDVRERRLRQIDAADILNISPRQVRRLLSQLSQYGASSLAHGSRGRPSNRRYPDAFRAEVLNIIRAQYIDGSYHDWFEGRSPKCFSWFTSMMPQDV